MSTLTIYATGTITFTNASAAITGVGTTLIGLQQGDLVLAPDGHWYELASAPSDNLAATLDRSYAGTTATNSPGGSGWVIFRSSVSRDSVRTATKQLTDISSVWRQIMNLTQSDETADFSKAATGDRAGMILSKALVDMFQVGTFQDDDFSVRYLLASTWTKAFAINGTTGAATIFAQLLLGNGISPVQITADTDDYAPANLAQANLLRVSTSSSKNLTGLTGGSAGRVLALINAGTHDLVLKAESNSSVAANRFGLTIDLVIPGGSSTVLIYDGVSSRWRPMGGQGAGGTTIGTVTTGDAGSSASVTNSGSAMAPVLNFSIPKGDVGPVGPQGVVGPQGDVGPQGAVGPQGTAATVEVGTVTTGAAGSSAAVTNAGTANAATLNFTIPRGAQGATGASYGGTSNTSMPIVTGSEDFVTQANLAYQVGNYIRLASIASGINYMEGYVTAYNVATGAISVNFVKIGGSGTFASWSLGISTESGGIGNMVAANNLSEVVSPAAAATNLGVVRYGGAQTLTGPQQAQARANMNVQKKNYIVNGGMQVNQENPGVTGTTSSFYPVDQFWLPFSHAGSVSMVQAASPTPGASPNRLRVTVNTADATVGAGDFLVILQRIEGSRIADLRSGSAQAKTITIQFGCKGPAGTYGLTLRNGSFIRAYAAEFVIAAGEANTDVIKSVTIALDQAGTWATDNSLGIDVAWVLMLGSNGTLSPNVWAGANAAMPAGSGNVSNFMGTSGNVFELFDVGLYEGPIAPAFQLPDFPSELMLSKRYWRSTYEQGTPAGSTTASGCFKRFPDAATSYNVVAPWRIEPPMRATPTGITYAPQSGTVGKIRNMDAGTDVPAGLEVSTTWAMAYVNNSTIGASTTCGVHIVLSSRM
jgi:hypothetical protein